MEKLLQNNPKEGTWATWFFQTTGRDILNLLLWASWFGLILKSAMQATDNTAAMSFETLTLNICLDVCLQDVMSQNDIICWDPCQVWIMHFG